MIDYTMPFGRYRGQSLHDLPREYLEWLDTVARPPLRSYVASELRRRRGRIICVDMPLDPRVAEDMVVAGERALRRNCRGDADAVAATHATADALVAIIARYREAAA